jgi:PAS domain S-box-containing protein
MDEACLNVVMSGTNANGFPSATGPSSRKVRPGILFLPGVICLALVIAAAGWLYYRNERNNARKTVYDVVSTVSALRAKDLSYWYLERTGDIEVVGFGLDPQLALKQPTNVPPNVGRRVENFRRVYDYAAVVITDTNGTIKVLEPTNFPVNVSILQSNVQRALQSEGLVRSDFREMENGKLSPYLWWSHAVYPLMQTNGTPIGTVSLVIDLRHFVYPRLSHWPVPTKTGQSVLVLRTNDLVVFRTPTNCTTVKQTSRQVEHERPSLTALATLGVSGVYEAQDVDGVPVIIAQAHVEGTPWLIQTRIDESEALGALRRESWEVAVIIGLLLLTIGLGARLYWRQQMLAVTLASEERMRTLIDDAPEGVAICRGGKAIYVNTMFLRMFRFGTLEEVIGKDATEFWWRGEKARAVEEGKQQEFQFVAEGAEEFEATAQRKDGTQFPIRVSVKAVMLRDGRAHLAFVRDITDRKAAEEGVQRLNRLYAVLSGINVLVVRERNVDVIFQRACELAVDVGEFRMAWIGKLDEATRQIRPVAWAGQIDGYLDKVDINLDDPARRAGPMSQAHLTGEHQIINDIESDERMAPWRGEALKRGYGSIGVFPLKLNKKWVAGIALYGPEKNWFDAEELRLLDGLATDIGFALEVHQKEQVREEAEAKLRASEERFRRMIENASDIITVLNKDGVQKFVGPSVKRVLGYEPQDLLNRNVLEFIEANDREKAVAALQQALSDPSAAVRVECRFRHRDGTWRTMETVGRNIPGLAEDGYVVINSRDITESRKLEELFRQAQKMEGIGQLAGGVAHDFNNILAAMMMQTELLQYAKNVPPEVVEGLKQITSYSERAANLTRQLLLFSRKQVLQQRDVEVNELILNISRMLQRIIGENYSLKLNLSSRLVLTRADPGMLDQVLLNLVNNARDAMSNGGEIVVETGETTLTAAQAQSIPDALEGSYVYISVADRGTGISPENLKHIFEPFFTTKPPGKGTGLGLATVFGIVQSHRGFITVKSEVGRGTCFRIHLPLGASQPASPMDTSFIAKEHRGSGTVFVVEDEAAVRELTRTILEASGYKVIEAENGVEAQRIWKDIRGEVDLLFTDMVMPEGVTGWQLANKFQMQNPKLKVIFASGYSAEYASQELKLKRGQMFLQKPYSSKQILKAVRECLEG